MCEEKNPGADAETTSAEPPVNEEAGEEKADAEKASEPSVSDETKPSEPAEAEPKEEPVTYAFQWDYRSQYEHDRAEKKTLRVRAGLLYTLIVVSIFAVAIAVLAVVLAVGSLRAVSSGQIGPTGNIGGSYSERVVYVNSGDDDSEDLAVEAAVAKMLPSTVSIRVRKASGGSGIGSGVICSEDGYIITNHHVIDGMSSITVRLYGGTLYSARLVGSDEMSDLALLKIDATGLTPAAFGVSADLLIGETVMAIGTPTGINYAESVTRGIVSCTRRALKVYKQDGTLSHTLLMLQTDASVNPGNSGGALIDRRGEVVGIVTNKTIFYENGEAYYADGMGLAIPAEAVTAIVSALKNGTTPDRSAFLIHASRIGITGRTVTATAKGGVSVEGFTSSRFDAAQKLRIGDVIVAVNGIAVSDIAELLLSIEDFAPGTSVTFTVLRDGTETAVEIILGSDDLA